MKIKRNGNKIHNKSIEDGDTDVPYISKRVNASPLLAVSLLLALVGLVLLVGLEVWDGLATVFFDAIEPYSKIIWISIYITIFLFSEVLFVRTVKVLKNSKTYTFISLSLIDVIWLKSICLVTMIITWVGIFGFVTTVYGSIWIMYLLYQHIYKILIIIGVIGVIVGYFGSNYLIQKYVK